MIKKQCNRVGCNELIPRGQQPPYCKKHLAKMRKDYDTTKRDPKLTRFYKSGNWKRLREIYLKSKYGLCEICLDEGTIQQGDTVHHKTPIETAEGWEQRLDTSNMQLVCRECHAKIHKEKSPFFHR